MDRRLAELGVPAEKVRRISNWTDGEVVRPLPGRSPLRKAWGLEDRFVVMHSGNVGLSQGLETLVEAAGLLAGCPDITFVIVGDGAGLPSLRAETARRRLTNVVFLPYQPRQSLAESLGAADVLLVSLRRGLAGYVVPSKVYAAMAAGKPLLVAAESGSEPGLIVTEHRCGLHIEPQDSGGLARAVLAMCSADRAQLGRRARRAFEQHYERRIATTAYRNLLEEVASEASNRVWAG
jgi:glycosyltransferase involved in cell wall biosynthesis